MTRFPLYIHWPDYTEDQQTYIRQDIADELYGALEDMLTASQPQHTIRHVFIEEAQEKARIALAKARGDA